MIGRARRRIHCTPRGPAATSVQADGSARGLSHRAAASTGTCCRWVDGDARARPRRRPRARRRARGRPGPSARPAPSRRGRCPRPRASRAPARTRATASPARAHTRSATPRAWPSLAAACGVLREEERLDARLVGRVRARRTSTSARSIVDEALGDGRLARRCATTPCATWTSRVPRALDDAPAEVARARIEPEHDRVMRSVRACEARELLVGDVEVGVDVLHVVVVVERLGEVQRDLRRRGPRAAS